MQVTMTAPRPAPSPLIPLLILLVFAAAALGVIIDKGYSHAHAGDAEALVRCFNSSPTAQKAMFRTTDPDRFLHVCVEPGKGVFFQILDRLQDGKMWERTAYKHKNFKGWIDVLKYIEKMRYTYIGGY